jgi:hypothetical protein
MHDTDTNARARRWEPSIVKPPRRPELEGRIVARERHELAAVRSLIERKENDREPRFVAKTVEQRLERFCVLRGTRNVGAAVATVCLEQQPIVAAIRSGMNLHHQSVVETHSRHLDQHLRPKHFGVRNLESPADYARKKLFTLDVAQVRGARARVSMICRRRTRLRADLSPAGLVAKARPGRRVAHPGCITCDTSSGPVPGEAPWRC